MTNLYEVLGLKVGAEPADVRAAFHRLAKNSHPDVNIGDATAEQRFKVVNEAYEILGNLERRAAYDLGLKHKYAEMYRRVRNAIAATAASFMITVGCGLYLTLSDVGQFAAHHEPTAPSRYARPAPQPKQDRLRQRAERWTKADSGPTPSPPDPQPQRDRTSLSNAELGRQAKFPTAQLVDENVAVEQSPPPSPPVHQTQHAQPRTEPPRREGRRPATHAGEREGAKRVAQAKLEADAAAARERDGREEAKAEAARFQEQSARLAVMQTAEAEAAAAAVDDARRKKREEEEAEKKKKEDEEARAAALAEAETKRKAKEEQKEQRMALCARAGHFHVKGMGELETGNVIGAREFFRLGADEGLWQSAQALAETYDPEQLSKFKVLGLQPDNIAAKEWYEKAQVLGERPLCEVGEFKRMLSLVADKPEADADLELFRAAYTSGDGLAYVVIRDAKDERIYRYGDESRSAAKKNVGAYTLYTCNERHLFVLQNQQDKAALLKATVVKAGEPRFLERDGKYVSGCNNPDIRSAVPAARR